MSQPPTDINARRAEEMAAVPVEPIAWTPPDAGTVPANVAIAALTNERGSWVRLVIINAAGVMHIDLPALDGADALADAIKKAAAMARSGLVIGT